MSTTSTTTTAPIDRPGTPANPQRLSQQPGDPKPVGDGPKPPPPPA